MKKAIDTYEEWDASLKRGETPWGHVPRDGIYYHSVSFPHDIPVRSGGQIFGSGGFSSSVTISTPSGKLPEVVEAEADSSNSFISTTNYIVRLVEPTIVRLYESDDIGNPCRVFIDKVLVFEEDKKE